MGIKIIDTSWAAHRWVGIALIFVYHFWFLSVKLDFIFDTFSLIFRGTYKDDQGRKKYVEKILETEV